MPNTDIEKLAKVAGVDIDLDVENLPPQVVEEATRKLAMAVLTGLVQDGKADDFVTSLVRQHNNRGSLSAKQWPHAVRNALAQVPDPDMPDTVADARRKGANDSPGSCEGCGHTVAQREGYFYGPHDQGKKWRVHHKAGQCSTEPVPAPVTVEEGYYIAKRGDEEVLIQAYVTRNQRIGGKVFTGARFEYQKGAVHLASTGRKVTEQEMAEWICQALYGAKLGSEELRAIAAKHGTEHGNCMFCTRDLSDPRSDPVQGGVGYGKVCAGRYGLPWG